MGHPITNIAEKDGKISFLFDGGTPSAIESVNARVQDAQVYDLQGRCVRKVDHGIFIKDGRTYMKR